MSINLAFIIKNFQDICKFQYKQALAWNTLLEEDCKYLLYGGSAAGGKSYFLRWASIGLAIWYYQRYGIRGVPIGLFSEDYPTLKDRQISRIKREVPPWIGQLKESRDEGYIFQLSPKFGSGVILLRNLDDPSKYQSVEFAAICVEELTKNPRETFDDLRFRLRFPNIPDPRFVGATNPGGVGHGWVKSLWIDHNTDDPEQNLFKFIPAKYADNKYIDASYVTQLQSLPERKRKAYMEGSWDIFEGQFFAEWRETDHVIAPFIPKDDDLIVGGMDWGRAKPFAFLISKVEKVYYKDFNPYFRVKTFMEVYGTEKTPKQWAFEIRDRLKFYDLKIPDIDWIRGDPAMFTKGNDNSISIADQFKEYSVVIKPASNDRIGGWENLHKWLSVAPDGKPYWQITSNCQNLIRTLPQLVHDDVKFEDVDTDGEDHAPDACRYKFKHLKWLDGRVGAVLEDQGDKRPKTQFFATMNDQGQQISINPDRFIG